MFTGIIEQQGQLIGVSHQESESVFNIQLKGSDYAQGESIAVNGVCLTLTKLTPELGTQNSVGTFYVSSETLKCTAFSTLLPGQVLNLERSLTFGGRVSGHFVQGHVDGVAQIESIKSIGQGHEVRFRMKCKTALLIPKGSIAVDGVSLTVNQIIEGSSTAFEVFIIPQTWEHTRFSGYQIGDQVNVEFDFFGKYIERYLSLGGKPHESASAP